jgi:hypothetical protein
MGVERQDNHFFDSKREDPSQGSVADQAYPFELFDEDQLIIDEYSYIELGESQTIKKNENTLHNKS